MTSMRELGIEYDYEQLRLDGATIRRPDRISPSQWLKFWDEVNARNAGVICSESDECSYVENCSE